MSDRLVSVGNYRCGKGQPLLWMLGPCVIESHDLTLSIADTLRKLADRLSLQVVFKASFDKANRTSGKSFRGPGLHEQPEDRKPGGLSKRAQRLDRVC